MQFAHEHYHVLDEYTPSKVQIHLSMLEVKFSEKDVGAFDRSNAVSQSVLPMQMEKERFVDAHPR